MFCPYCGSELDDGDVFCTECGKHLTDGTSVESDLEMDDFGKKEAEEQSPSKTKIAIGIGAVILIAAVGIGVFYYKKSKPTVADNVAKILEEENKKENSNTDLESESKEETSSEEKVDTNSTDNDEINAPKVIQASDISMSVADTNPADLGNYSKLTISSASASSRIVQEGYDNSAAMVMDGNMETSWQEGVDGDGVGETITLNFSKEQKVKYIELKLGNWRTERHYEKNGKPSSLQITMGDCSKAVGFSGNQVGHWITVSDEWPTNSITFRINDVYTGSEYQDTCINEITVYGE